MSINDKKKDFHIKKRVYGIISIIPKVIKRNKIILGDLWRTASENQVNLHWWKNGNNVNLGDYLSVIVVDYMLKQRGISSYNSKCTRHLYAIGSIINAGYQNATIWGSGCLWPNKFWWRFFRKLDVRSVRGPLTRKILQENGYIVLDIYGDPAILMPLIYPCDRNYKYEYIIIPHFTDIKKYSSSNDETIAIVNMMTMDYKRVINIICSAKLVISSSLHGIILAEAYGVPAILLKTNHQDLFKYQDYYEGTGRKMFPIAVSVEEALEHKPCTTPNLKDMQRIIMDAFPYDLWESSYIGEK